MSEPKRKDHELSRVYSEGTWPEPSRQIDEAILAASRRAARARHPVFYRWGAPFALAATVVVGVSLALLVAENDSVRELGDYFGSPPPAAPPPAPQRKREAAVPAPKPDAAPRSEPAPPPRDPGQEQRAPEAPAPAAKAPAPLAKAAPPAANAGAIAAPKAPPLSGAQQQAPLRAAPAPDAQRADRIRRGLDQLEENRTGRDTHAFQDPSAEANPAAPSASVSDIRGLAGAGAAGRPPETWLDDIRKLKAQGRAADAERELTEFRKRYPDYRVPEDLR